MNESVELYDISMTDGYKMEIKSQVQGALAVIQRYYDMGQNGELTEEEAKKLAAEAVRTMRYRDDSSGYIWIDGKDCTLVMHPILTEQEGTNRRDLTDQNGVKVTQNVVSAAESGGDYLEFYFTICVPRQLTTKAPGNTLRTSAALRCAASRVSYSPTPYL